MTVIEAIKGRRSIRKFSREPVGESKLLCVLEAARLAPSANNMQDWKFIVVSDPAVKDKLAEAAFNQEFIRQAPVAIVACGLKRRLMTCGQPADTVDCSIAVSYMTLEAYEQGLGTCWLGWFDQAKVKSLLGVPEDASVIAITPLGYPAESPSPRPRKNLAEIIGYDRYE